MISQTFSPELKEFVQSELAAGRYQSETELVQAAVQLLRERALQFQKLRAEVQQRLEDLKQGKGIVVERKDLRGFFDDLVAEVDEQLAAETKAAG